MDINKNNYEAWLLDLIEGNLSAKESHKLRDFLLLNPDCAADLDDSTPLVLEAEEISFSGKADLHKEIPGPHSTYTDRNFDLFSIAMLEGDLTKTQEDEYLRVIEEDDEKFREWLLWKQMRLEEGSLIYEHKSLLKKRKAPRFGVVWISIASAAAAALLFFALVRFDQGLKPGSQLSQEAEANPEIPFETEVTVRPDIKPLSEDLSLRNMVPPGNEVAELSLVSHQDAPESANAPESKDHPEESSEAPVSDAVIEERPVKMAMLDKNLILPSLQVKYDRIKAIDIQSDFSEADQQAGEPYPADGLKQNYQEFIEKKNISLLSIASAGVEGINRVAGSDLSLDVARDEEGEVSGFRFRSALISIDSPLKKQNISR